ncbi:MAG TPA: hypothetical protein VFG43_01495 [Geminicoccaceae bacterium]|nr:hypothetical protein [Geminicoccaceae bacterium]
MIDLEGVLRHCPAKLQGRTGAACTEDPLADWGEVLLRNKS